MRRLSGLLVSALVALAFAAPPSVAASPGDCSQYLYGWDSAQLAPGFWSEGTHSVSWYSGGELLKTASFDVAAEAPMFPGQVTISLMLPIMDEMFLLQDSTIVPFGEAGLQVINPDQRTDLMHLWMAVKERQDAELAWNGRAPESVVIDGGTRIPLLHSPLVSACMGGMGWMNTLTDHGANGAFHRAFGPRYMP